MRHFRDVTSPFTGDISSTIMFTARSSVASTRRTTRSCCFAMCEGSIVVTHGDTDR
jgi:hypothetical protein